MRRRLRSLLRIAKNAVTAVVERFWALGFAAAGRIARPRARRWSSAGGQRVLVIAPHPDDEACGCAGTIALHRRHGDAVRVAYVTDGRRSRALGLGPEEMARRRRHEAEASARALGIERMEWLGLPEGEWRAEQLGPRLSALIGDLAPDVVYAPSRIDFHPEHFQAALALALALAGRPAGARAPLVRIYQVQVPLAASLTNLVADVSGARQEIVAALRAYATQWGSVARTLRMRGYAAAFHGAGRYAEEFWELDAEEFRRLHGAPADGWPARAFRGLRMYPWSDPLAYVWGRSERRAVRAAGLKSMRGSTAAMDDGR
jgi:LmbE family N-acetylglucosaminyl deacetylase